MSPENETIDNGILLVTGSNLRAEQIDRPLAYMLANCMLNMVEKAGGNTKVTVISDLWYLNSEPLKELPTISIGSPNINAVTAFFSRRLENVLVIDNQLSIQMDLSFQDLRAAIWGIDLKHTQESIFLFKEKGYLEKFVNATCKWYSHP